MEITRENYIEQPSPIEKELKCLFKQTQALTICDIGCCEGQDSIKYQKLFPASRILAFEPLPDNIQIIKKLWKKYNISNAEIFDVALSNQIGERNFYVSSGHPDNLKNSDQWDFGNKSSSLLPPNELEMKKYHNWLSFSQIIKVKTDTLDNFCEQHQISTIDLIHLDVQGAELDVLQGGVKMLENVSAIWLEVEAVELYQNQPLKQEIENFLDDYNFIKVKDTCDEVSGDQLYIKKNKKFKYQIQIFLSQWLS